MVLLRACTALDTAIAPNLPICCWLLQLSWAHEACEDRRHRVDWIGLGT